MSNTLALRPGTRLRTGGTTYEVTGDADVPAGAVEVVPQATRLLKVHCETCGYTARITQRWITKAGTPDCPSGHGAMVVAPPKEKTVSKKKAAALAKAAKAAIVTPEPEPIPQPEPEPEPTLDDVYAAIGVEPDSTQTPLEQLLAELKEA